MPKVHNYHKAMEKHERSQRLRKSKKRMRPNTNNRKPRQKNWDYMADDEWDAPGFIEEERVMPRGTEERHKVVEALAKQSIQQTGEGVEWTESDLPPGTQKGVVREAVGERCSVLLEDRMLDCTVRRSLLTKETTYTSVVAAGDVVAVRAGVNGDGVVEQVMPRRSVLARPYRPNKGAYSSLRQIVAANIDQVLIVASWRKPSIWPELIDRYLIAAERNHLKAVICINKVDLVEDQVEFEEVMRPYREAGYQVILTSAETGVGIDLLRELLKDSTTVFTGLSGVGKSSLLAQIQPGLRLRALSIGERGKNRNQGRHTTTMAALYPLDGSGAVIDTPGIREFGLAFLDRQALPGYYPEIARAATECEFLDCTHTHEPNCGVKAAVVRGSVSQMRYDNYQKILCTLS